MFVLMVTKYGFGCVLTKHTLAALTWDAIEKSRLKTLRMLTLKWHRHWVVQFRKGAKTQTWDRGLTSTWIREIPWMLSQLLLSLRSQPDQEQVHSINSEFLSISSALHSQKKAFTCFHVFLNEQLNYLINSEWKTFLFSSELNMFS